MQLTSEFTDKLKALASKQTNDERATARGEEYFNVMDDSGGNFDDAYSMGTDDGEIYMARQVLDDIGVDYEVEA